jgi:hypothetical protein
MLRARVYGWRLRGRRVKGGGDSLPGRGVSRGMGRGGGGIGGEGEGHGFEGLDPRGVAVEAGDEGEGFGAAGFEEAFTAADTDFLEGFEAIGDEGGTEDEEASTPSWARRVSSWSV